MFWWVTVPMPTPGSHMDSGLAYVAPGIEVEVGLGVVGHHPGLGGQHGDEGQNGHGRVVDDGPRTALATGGIGPGSGPDRVVAPARRRKGGEPTRVIGSVNNRPLTMASSPWPVATARKGAVDPPSTWRSPMSESSSTPGQRGVLEAARRLRPGPRLTGERPMQGVTPDSLLALHAAGYRTVIERLGPGRLLDVGCGQGFESARFLAEGRTVFGVDYSAEAVAAARQRWEEEGLSVAQMNALDLGCTGGAFDWACSSHLIEHFDDPEGHVRELARVLADDGTAFFLTPNAPADFENPFHIHLFEPPELRCTAEPPLR